MRVNLSLALAALLIFRPGLLNGVIRYSSNFLNPFIGVELSMLWLYLYLLMMEPGNVLSSDDWVWTLSRFSR